MRITITAGVFLLAGTACAGEHNYSTNLYGALGLNTVPSARMDETGTIRLGVSTLDPYAHSTISLQVAKPLAITIRQSAEMSGLLEDPDRLYPGIDFRLRLLQEDALRPDLTIGIQSAIGHKRMAGEYLVASKRFGDFDFTAGLGWGRYGTAGNFENPLGMLLGHFDKERSVDGEMPGRADDWFTGDETGIFGGVEYFTPIKGLSFKADWSADRYEAEKAAIAGFDAPPPWSLGFSYSPASWISMSAAAQGTDKLMARISLQGLVQNWRDQAAQEPGLPMMRTHRAGPTDPGRIALSAAESKIFLNSVKEDGHNVQGALALNGLAPSPRQIGRAAVSMANNAAPGVEEFTLIPTVMGLQGPSVRVMRRDFEKALLQHQSSPEEIWHNTEFDAVTKKPLQRLNRFPGMYSELYNFRFISDTQLSISEEDSGLLYRTSLLAKMRAPQFLGFLDGGIGLRLNVADNLAQLRDLRPLALLPVRSDVDAFAGNLVALEESYIAWTHSFRPDLHMALTAGYLEEMYAGAGGEILYRPFGPRFALGAETWLALRRDPYVSMAMGLNGDHLLTGHLNAWYDVPEMDVTLKARAGRYLAEDTGFSLGLEKTFGNGAKVEGFTTLTNAADFDLFGGTTHMNHGLRLSLPLGGFKHMPDGAQIRVRAEPFGRDIGQAIENPVPLYELTEPFSYRHMMDNWNEILPTKKEPPEGG